MPSCREVSRQIASASGAAGSWRQRLGRWLHLLACAHCRRYAAQVRALGRASRRLFPPGTEDREAVERLQDSLLEAIDGAESEPRRDG